MKPLKGLAVLGVTVGILSSVVLSRSDRPFDLIGVKFCPKTANIGQENETQAQIQLNQKYCRYEHKILKSVWVEQQFNATLPLPDDSFIIREFPRIDTSWWFLVSPVFMGVGYLAWARQTEKDELSAHYELEGFKTGIKINGVSARQERQFKTQVISRKWDNQRVKAGLISVDAIADQMRRQSEITDKTHEAALKQLDLGMAEMSKGIAENVRDAHKADKERLSNSKAAKPDKTPASDVEIELELDSDYLWYNRVLNEPCKVITGVSGSGKSTLEHALIQLARQDNQHTIIIYPNTTRTARNNSTVLSDAEEINEFLAGFNDLVVNRKKDAKQQGIDEDDYLDEFADKRGLDGRIAIFAMEVNNWEPSGVDPDLIAQFYKLCFTDIRKWGVTLSMTGQSINQGSVASKLANFSKLLGQQTKIECQATTCERTGKSISKGLALVTYSDQSEPQELKLCFYKPKNKAKY